jgi:PKD repeat protein
VAQDETFTLDGMGSTDNMAIEHWLWEVLDGDVVMETMEGITVDLAIGDPGEYTVRLTVHDARGNEGVDTIALRVRDLDAPRANAGEDYTVDQGETAALDGSASTDEVGITGYTWTFREAGLDITHTGVTPEHEWNVAGTFEVTLEVLNTRGFSDTDTVTVTVRDTEEPVPAIARKGPFEVGAFTLDGSGSSDNVAVVNWSWVVVHGNEITHLYNETAEYEFYEEGNYDVTLTVRDAEGNEASSEHTFKVEGEGGGSSLFVILVIVILAGVGAAVIWYVTYR